MTQKFENPQVWIVDNFLPEHEADAVYKECVALEPVYRDAEVLGAKVGESRSDEKIRRNQVVYLDDVFRNNVKRCKIFNLVRDGVYKQSALWSEGHTGFEMINYATRWETVLSRYGNGDFYDYHRDYNHAKANRLVTAIYYANNGKFTGGHLDVKGLGMGIAPVHNRLVVFNSGAYHAVERTVIEDDSFANGRFSVNIWMGFQS